MRARFFDMDGALLHRTSAPVLLGNTLGHADGLAVSSRR
jgi:hypothetical protein